MEIELAVEVTKTVGGEASVKVLNLFNLGGGKGERSRVDTNTVTVVLNPIGRDGKPFEVASTRRRRPDATPPTN